MKAEFSEAWRSLTSAKQRTALALVGIVIGIASVIAMVTVGGMAREASLAQFKEMGTDVLSIEKEFSATANRRELRLSLAMVDGLPEAVAAVQRWGLYTQGGGGAGAIYRGKPVERANMVGVAGAFLPLNRLTVSEGRALSPLDAGTRHAVVGADLAAQMRTIGGRETVVGEPVKLGEQLYRVVGVLEPVSGGGMRRFDANSLFLVDAGLALRSPGTEIAMVQAQVRPGSVHKSVSAQIERFFAAQRDAPPVRVSSPEDLLRQLEQQARTYTWLLGAIGSIALVVGGVGVMNVMLVSVHERRREIGIRRAIGARRGSILTQFLAESLILSLVGGVLGVILGQCAAWLVGRWAGWPFVVSWGAIGVGVGVSTLVGIFFGYYPARQAAMMDPIAALRAT